MSTYAALQYAVVTGTVAGIATFNTNVQAQIASGWAPVSSPWTDGTNINQTFSKVTGSAITAAWGITVAPTTGAAGAAAFTLVGDQTLQFPIGFKFTVVGSTANDGIYSVRAAPTFGGGNTVIPVNEAVGSAATTGQIIQFAAH